MILFVVAENSIEFPISRHPEGWVPANGAVCPRFSSPSTHKAQPTANNAQNGYCFPLFREGTGSMGNEEKRKIPLAFQPPAFDWLVRSGTKAQNVSGLPGPAKHGK